MRSLVAFVSLACLLCVTAFAGTLKISTMPYRADIRVQPFAKMPYPEFVMLDGATVSIEFGYASGFDKLFVDYPGPFDIQGTFDQLTGTLHLTGEAPVSEYNVALSSVVFSTSAADGANRRLTWTYGKSTYFLTSTEHYYKYMSVPLKWDEANERCNSMQLMGKLQGYLATITSEQEQYEVGMKTNSSFWLGGAGLNGTYQWMTGPEKGTSFWEGLNMYRGGKSDGDFTQWYRFQPDSLAKNLTIADSKWQGAAYWNDQDNTVLVKGYICEFGGMENSSLAMDELVSFAGTVDLVYQCSLLTTKNECENNAGLGCGWNGAACQITSCRRHDTESACVNDWKCDWNLNGRTGRCVSSYCSQYSDSETCNSDNQCQFRTFNGVQKCMVARCDSAASYDECARINGCTFRKFRCGSEAGMNCDMMDVVYLLDGTAPMGGPFGKHTQGFFGLTENFINAQQFLTLGTPQPGSTSFGQRVGFVQYGASVQHTNIGLTGIRAELVSEMKFHQSRFNKNAEKREIGGALDYASSLLSGMPDRKKIVVIFAAGDITDATAAAAKTQAMMSSGVTVIGIPLWPTPTSSFNTEKATASLEQLAGSSNVMGTTLEWLANRVIYGLCSNSSTTIGGMAKKAATSIICPRYPTALECNADTFCGWDKATNMCKNSVCMKRSPDVCDQAKNCKVFGTVCTERCPLTQQSSCNNGLCQWNAAGAYCEPLNCTAAPDEDGCIAGDKCVFNPANPTACEMRKCNSNNEADCVKNTADSCSWSTDGGSDACFENLCKGATADACAKVAQCELVNGICTLGYCGSHVNEQNCQRDRKCRWTVGQAPAACGPHECRILNNNADPKADCMANSNCLWSLASQNGFGDMCMEKTCDALLTSNDCATLDGCVWRDDACRDNDFVQCKPIDAIFLVEATAHMSKAFGRHPNGFIGIVEAIRTWSWRVPFSKNIDTPGFRLGFIGYGAQRALANGPGTGAGGNLTANIATWAEPKMELDTMETQFQQTYMNNAMVGSNIKDGLVKAAQMFKNNAEGNNRKKMLIILGASPITDGANNVDFAISELEDMGVTIFANVVRRFSSITPFEQEAASYLRPLASDPHQQTFQFTTIDMMEQTLLSGFCDPTTGTGQALEISRDGILPCEWLLSDKECNVQPSCSYDTNANLTCPQANQCPQFDCIALPPALVSAGFECKHCKLVSGAFSCSRQNTQLPDTGLCKKSPCAYGAKAQCQAGTVLNGKGEACRWSDSLNRCEESLCAGQTQSNCVMKEGCTWVSSSSTCRRSQCGLIREQSACNTFSIRVNGEDIEPCSWYAEETPALCLEKQCPYYDQAACAGDSRCVWNTGAGRCDTLECTWQTSERCEMDAGCYWDPFDLGAKKCKPRTPNCQISSYSPFSPCSATCGLNAIKYKSRSIVQYPSTGTSCAERAQIACQSGGCNNDCGSVPAADCNKKMVEARSCASDAGWPSDCSSHCAGYGIDLMSCAEDISCEWKGGACIARNTTSCAELGQAACSAAGLCEWNTDLQFCEETITVCRRSTESSCTATGGGSCLWVTGAAANMKGSMGSLPVRLFSPQQKKEIFVFPSLKIIDTNDTAFGASVTIETNYVRGKDVLEMTYPSNEITSRWMAASGTLKLSGKAKVSEYQRVLRAVSFFTTSTSTDPRAVTWSYGNSTILSSVTGHHYRAVFKNGATYQDALMECQTSKLFGLHGYLATITSSEENTVVTNKVGGIGWVSGTAVTTTIWKYGSGPETGSTFWMGMSAIEGGHSVSGGFANWAVDQPSASTLAGGSNPYINFTGYWESLESSSKNTEGFVCEYGGSSTDMPPSYAIGGAAIVGTAGCLPKTCAWHFTQSDCVMDDECQWTGTKCIPGCSQRSSFAECEGGSSDCKWDTAVVPPVCDINRCRSLGQIMCIGQSKCEWTDDGCEYKSGCAQYDSESSCNAKASCLWSADSNGGVCGKRPCNTNRDQATCTANPLCEWNGGVCASVLCRYGNEGECSADKECTWSDAQGNAGSFAPGGSRSLVFSGTMQPPDDIETMVDGVTVMLQDGFAQGQDVLTVDAADNVAGTFLVTYNSMTGVLTMKTKPGVSMTALGAFNFMKQSVKFYTSATSLQRRVVSYTLGLNTVRTANNAYLKWFPTEKFATKADASAFCMGKSYFGLSGMLGTIPAQVDNLKLKALLATGWIGASMTSGSGSTATWSWQVGGSSMEFWKGAGVTGSPSPTGSFAQWGSGEPASNAVVNDGAFMTDSGMWRAMVSGMAAPKGVICQFGDGSMYTSSVVSASRTIMPQGCYKTPCIGIGKPFCLANPQCLWNAVQSTCGRDVFCPRATNITDCNNREGCFFDYAVGSCRAGPSSFCSDHATDAECGAFDRCEWIPGMLRRNGTLGACRSVGCTRNPTKESCTADATCRWDVQSGSAGTCVDRLCGYQTSKQCWADPFCRFIQDDGCSPSPCYASDQATCGTRSECQWDATLSVCKYLRCSSGIKDNCMADAGCLFTGGSCMKPNCQLGKAACEAEKDCYYDESLSADRCQVAQCSVNTDQATCEKLAGNGFPECKWEAGQSYCRELTYVERMAPTPPGGSCEKEEEPNLWWLWLLLVVVFGLLGGIVYRLYLAYAKGLSFFEAKKNTKKFSPYEGYTDELFEEAQNTGMETNLGGQPALNDL